jgi:Tfp pilus assembly protein PilO
MALTLLLVAANFPLRGLRHAAVVEHDAVRRKGELMLRSMSNRGQIKQDLGVLEPAIAQIQRNLLDEQSMEVNLGYFYKLERPAHVRLVRLNQLIPPPTTTRSEFKVVPFSMQVVGSYRNTMSFLRSLETGTRILRIRNCTFERGVNDSSDLTLDLTVEVLARS